MATKANMKNYASVKDFIKADEKYNEKRLENGQAQGRASFDAIDMLADLVRVAKNLNIDLEKMSGRAYNEGKGNFTRSGMEKRFGSWTKARGYAVEALELNLINETEKASSRAIAKDIRRVAQAKQVNVLSLKRSDYESLGRFTRSIVESRFGTWTNARNHAYDMFVNHDWEDTRGVSSK